MALFNVRNFMNIGCRVKRLSPPFVRYINQHPNCNEIIGSREWVGHGRSSEQSYDDCPAMPFPAIRFREDTPEICALRQKEKGDWRKMTLDEKRTLYRASFCQTFEELLAPTGKEKSAIGCCLFCVSLAIWLFMIMKVMYHPELPDTYSEPKQKAQLKRLIDLEMNPIHGLASKWDYQCGRWK